MDVLGHCKISGRREGSAVREKWNIKIFFFFFSFFLACVFGFFFLPLDTTTAGATCTLKLRFILHTPHESQQQGSHHVGCCRDSKRDGDLHASGKPPAGARVAPALLRIVSDYHPVSAEMFLPLNLKANMDFL